MKPLIELTRKNIWLLDSYSSQRNQDNDMGKAVWLDANENPYNHPFNRYRDPCQTLLKQSIAHAKGLDSRQIFVGNGMGSGGGIVVSQKFGAKDETGVRKSLTNAAYLMMGMAVIVCVISYLLTPTILTLLKTPSDIISDAISYMRMMCLGLPLVAIYNYSSFMLRALGDSRGPLYFLIVSLSFKISYTVYVAILTAISSDMIIPPSFFDFIK